MPVVVTTGESNIAVFYSLRFSNGSVVKMAAIPLDVRTATEVLGNVTEDYTLVIPLLPLGTPWPFLRDFAPQMGYVVEKLAVPEGVASLFSRLIPALTRIPPADELADIADKWYEGE